VKRALLVVGAADARHYAGLTRSVYRLAPLPLTSADLDRFHGVDERIAIADYLRAIAGTPSYPPPHPVTGVVDRP
jgi:acetylornithine deacetylase/succinyl-diaminopimelate desuccinylase-like protein